MMRKVAQKAVGWGTPLADTSPHQPATYVPLSGCAQKTILPHLIDSPYHCFKGVLTFWYCDKSTPSNNAVRTLNKRF
ncbi:hypothetical protein NDU88_002922 [Pleurodeles waltl]|uniref:Uncharacterized protein n=1 Tax=Pleurodeles waltl TaxID=8319 RepID=A0AAV7WMK9_PLEWA|nr:hypothetical protein NDU88_002922 [Pleurodeles waltl]